LQPEDPLGAGNVTEPPRRAGFVAHNYNRLASHLSCKKCLGIGNRTLCLKFTAGLAQPPNQLPRAPEDSLFLQRQHCGIGVEARRERFRTL
jgi:hypothetical protein